jgi:hypothetical protein
MALDPNRLDSLLSHLEGALTVEDVARRHGVSTDEVESWKALYLSGARASTGRPRRSPRAFLAAAAVFAASLGAFTALAQSTICSSGWPTQLICFSADTPALADQVNANFKKVWDGTVPVGAIVAWHKSLAATTLPSSFVECNGQMLTDTASPFNGLTIPNLNGEGRFLRGAATSGTAQADSMQSHRHDLNAGSTIHLLNRVHPAGSFELFGADQRTCTGASGCGTGYYDEYAIALPSLSGPTELSAGPARVTTETRPINMTVVWVMRVK